MALWTQQVWRGGLAVTTRCSAHCAFSLGLLSPQPCWAPGGPSLLAAAPADLRAGCLVQGNLGPGCLYLPHNARFHSGPPALVHGGASCPPLPMENQRIQLEEFSGVLPHPRPHRVTAQAHWGDTAREPRTPWELSGPIDLGAPPPVRASGQASQGAAHRGQLSWSPQITGAVPSPLTSAPTALPPSPPGQPALLSLVCTKHSSPSGLQAFLPSSLAR